MPNWLLKIRRRFHDGYEFQNNVDPKFVHKIYCNKSKCNKFLLICIIVCTTVGQKNDN